MSVSARRRSYASSGAGADFKIQSFSSYLCLLFIHPRAPNLIGNADTKMLTERVRSIA